MATQEVRRVEPARSLPWCARLGSSGETLALEPAGEDTWLGRSPEYPWGWVYGGRIAAQALQAAVLSASPDFAPSTLQCTFLRPARCDEPRVHRVERLADTRRRAARAVVVTQGGETLAHATATLDAAPGGDGVADLGRVPLDALVAARAGRFRGPVFDVGWFERRLLDVGPDRTAALLTLDRSPESLVDTACAVAYAADDLPTDAARGMFGDESYLEGSGTALWSLTATYAMHFGVQRAGRTLLFDSRTVGILGSRATIQGTVVDVETGNVVALCLQQVMMRRRKGPAA